MVRSGSKVDLVNYSSRRSAGWLAVCWCPPRAAGPDTSRQPLPRLASLLGRSALKTAFWGKDYSLKTWFLKEWWSRSGGGGGRAWWGCGPCTARRWWQAAASREPCSASSSAWQRGGRAKSTAWGVSELGGKVGARSVGDPGLPGPQASRFPLPIGPGVAELLLWMAALAVRRAHPRAELKPHWRSSCDTFLDMSVFWSSAEMFYFFFLSFFFLRGCLGCLRN